LAEYPNPKPIYKKTWFWVAVGAVAAGTIYYIAQKNKRDRQHLVRATLEQIAKKH
jgi:hypothetical protein